MASLYVVSQDAISTGTALKTMLELITASTARAKLVQWWIEFDSTNGSFAPVKVEIARASGGITGTTIAATKFDDYAPTAITTAKHTSTNEGTATDVLEIHRIFPTSGVIIQYPLGREISIPVSSFLRLRVTSANTINACVGMIFEE